MGQGGPQQAPSESVGFSPAQQIRSRLGVCAIRVTSAYTCRESWRAAQKTFSRGHLCVCPWPEASTFQGV